MKNQHQEDPSHVTKPDSDHHNNPSHSSDYAPYPKLDPNDVVPPPPTQVENWTSVSMGTQSPPQQPPSNPLPDAQRESPAPIAENSATTMPPESNPYVSSSPAPSSSVKNKVDSVRDVLGKWGKKAVEATKKAEDVAGNMWQHLKTGPSFADAAVGRIAQGTKVLPPSKSCKNPASMAIATGFTPSNSSSRFPKLNLHRSSPQSSSSIVFRATTTFSATSVTRPPNRRRKFQVVLFSGGDGINGGNGNSGGGGGGGGGGGDNAGDKNKAEAVMALAEVGRSLDSVPKDLAAAIESGKIPASVVLRYFELEKSAFFRWLLQFGGFKERLLADDLFFAKVFMECGVGLFTKTAAEYQRRGEHFFNELEFVFSDVVMAIIADFMLVYLPAPTVSLRPPLAISAGPIAKFFYNCPDNAFQVALAGTSYSLFQRIGAIVRNGTKLFAVGTASSLVGTAVTNALINARKAVDKSSAGEVENVPILSTSVAYGVYMAVSSNLRYQVLAGVIEQRMLEPLLHKHKVMLSAICFAVRTGNTFLGSLLWVDYARWIGIQKAQD